MSAPCTAQRTAARGHPQARAPRKARQPLGHGTRQQLEAQAFLGGDPHGGGAVSRIAVDARRALQPVDLVVEQDLGNLAGADLLQHPVHLRNLLLAPGVAGVHDVQQQGGGARLGERRLEGGHQLVGQLANEPHGIGCDHRRAARQGDAPDCWIERGEQLVRHVGVRAGERTKQR